MTKTLYQNTSFPHLQAKSYQKQNKTKNEQEGYTILWQDKQPPGRLGLASLQPATANDPAVGDFVQQKPTFTKPEHTHAKGLQKQENPENSTPHLRDTRREQPPRRLGVASVQPATAREPAVGNKEGRATATEYTADTPLAGDRPTHHGSETRQTAQVTGRVAYHIKTKLLEKADAQGWTESKAVGEACTVYVENDLAEQFSAKLASRVTDAIDTGLAKHSNREANLAVHAYYAAEESRILNAKVLAYLFGDDTHIYKQTLEHARREARANIRRAPQPCRSWSLA